MCLLIVGVKPLIRIGAVRRQQIKITCRKRRVLRAKRIGILLNVRSKFREFLLGYPFTFYLLRQKSVKQMSPNQNFSSVHSHAGVIPYGIIFVVFVQNEDGPARHILTEEAPRAAADDDDRLLLAVFLDVDAGAIANVVLDEDLAAAHRVAEGVAHRAVHHDLAVVHRIAHGVLSVAAHTDLRAVQIGAKRVDELYMYDVLRADRCISVNSLEARVPFGDLDFVKYVMSIDPALKRNVYNKGKYLLRRAFEGDYLPQSILYREKAAFSDAVGHSMVDDLKEYAEGIYTDEEFEQKRLQYAHATPFTKESLLYRELFEKYYPGQGQMIKDFWMPNKEWEGCNVTDPSARVLSNYGASGE